MCHAAGKESRQQQEIEHDAVGKSPETTLKQRVTSSLPLFIQTTITSNYQHKLQKKLILKKKRVNAQILKYSSIYLFL